VGEPVREPRLPELAAEAQRQPDDDFFCLRYGVWYPSYDCALRTKFETCRGCRQCEQGRFNLKRHNASLRRVRFPLHCID
jgi:hypothetical protein